MDKKDYSNGEYHLSLVHNYIYYSFRYSFSFKQRIDYNLGFIEYLLDYEDEEVMALSNEELEKRIKSLKAPWWNKIYEIVLEDHTFLLAIVWLLLNPRIILRILKSKEPQQ